MPSTIQTRTNDTQDTHTQPDDDEQRLGTRTDSWGIEMTPASDTKNTKKNKKKKVKIPSRREIERKLSRQLLYVPGPFGFSNFTLQEQQKASYVQPTAASENRKFQTTNAMHSDLAWELTRKRERQEKLKIEQTHALARNHAGQSRYRTARGRGRGGRGSGGGGGGGLNAGAIITGSEIGDNGVLIESAHHARIDGGGGGGVDATSDGIDSEEEEDGEETPRGLAANAVALSRQQTCQNAVAFAPQQQQHQQQQQQQQTTSLQRVTTTNAAEAATSASITGTSAAPTTNDRTDPAPTGNTEQPVDQHAASSQVMSVCSNADARSETATAIAAQSSSANLHSTSIAASPLTLNASASITITAASPMSAGRDNGKQKSREGSSASSRGTSRAPSRAGSRPGSRADSRAGSRNDSRQTSRQMSSRNMGRQASLTVPGTIASVGSGEDLGHVALGQVGKEGIEAEGWL